MAFIPDSQPNNKLGFVADKKTIGGFIGNVGSSAANLVGSTASAVLNPFDTVKNIIGLAKNPQTVIDYYKQRYGKDLLETLYNDPVGVAADLSVLVGGVGGIAKGVSGVAKLGEVGNVASTAGKVANVAGKVSKFSDPLQLAGMGAGKIAGKLDVPGKLLKASDSILTKGLGNPAKQAAIEAKFGVTAPQFIKKYNLYDRSPQKLAELEKSLGTQYGTIAKESTATFNPTKVIAEIDKKIEELSSGNAGLSSANQQMVKELTKRRNQFAETFPQGVEGTSVGGLVDFRRQAIDPDIPMSEFGLSPRQAGKSAGTKKVRDILKANINESEPRLKELGTDIAVAKGFKPVFGGSKSRGANRQMLGLPKQGATIGGILGGVPGVVGGAALDFLTNNPKSLGFFSKRLESAGRTLSKPVTMPKSAQIGYDIARAGRTVNLPMSEQTKSKDLTPPKDKKPNIPKPQSTPVKSYSDYTPVDTSTIKYTSPKLKSNVFSTRKLKKSNAY